ncbi:anti-sigma factor [Nocardia huaxiensis]|uniref:Regulator of SigK n=1 Tax=Nocardia huaxiensis TaxID=2755382 RepID=A0A7D6ZDT6_9NOCA|nr:anti-sigma factor [Nocardia huaxiensis]QLY28519.1 anti-sigma factor [Nocardia huaxiensis]UFS98024.1 anti-sigma factor [Nocardia huaxiensis]
MPDMPEQVDLRDLAYPYALDALPETQRYAVEAWLDTADDTAAAAFRATVREVRETLADMTVVDAVDAPPELEASILKALDRKTTPAPPRAWMRPMYLLTAAAALIAVIVLGAMVIRTPADHPGADAVTAQQILAEPGARATTTAVTGGGTVTVTVARDSANAVVTFDAVPQPPAAREYQLWLVPGAGAPRSAGVLAALPGRNSPLLVPIDGARALALSIEPVGGSAQPTTDPIVAVPLQ